MEEEEEKLKKVKKTNNNLEKKLRGNYKTQYNYYYELIVIRNKTSHYVQINTI